MDEITYLIKHNGFYDKDVSKFVSSELLEKEIDEHFNLEMMKIQQNNPFCKIRMTALHNKKKEDLESIDAFKKTKKIKI